MSVATETAPVEQAVVILGSRELNEAIGRVLHAVADNEDRPILATVLFEGDEKGFRLVAADNYRIAIARLSEDNHSAFGRVPIPRDDITVLRAFLKHHARNITLRVEGRALVVSEPHRSIRLPVLDGQFPNYESIFDGAERSVLAVNPVFLVDSAKALPKNTAMKIKAATPNLPVFIEGEDYTEAIMPIRVVD